LPSEPAPSKGLGYVQPTAISSSNGTQNSKSSAFCAFGKSRCRPAQLSRIAGLGLTTHPAFFVLGQSWATRPSTDAFLQRIASDLRETSDLARRKEQWPVAKAIPHGDKWRIRWLDEHGRRQSAVFDEYRRAQTELSRHQVEVEEIRRGLRKRYPAGEELRRPLRLLGRAPRSAALRCHKGLIPAPHQRSAALAARSLLWGGAVFGPYVDARQSLCAGRK